MWVLQRAWPLAALLFASAANVTATVSPTVSLDIRYVYDDLMPLAGYSCATVGLGFSTQICSIYLSIFRESFVSDTPFLGSMCDVRLQAAGGPGLITIPFADGGLLVLSVFLDLGTVLANALCVSLVMGACVATQGAYPGEICTMLTPAALPTTYRNGTMIKRIIHRKKFKKT